MIYEDLIGVMTDEQIMNEVENFREIDLHDTNHKWLAVTYIYAIGKGLKEYQARSFASELTLFITGEMFDAGVSHIFREEWLDSYLCRKYKELLVEQNYEKGELFWGMFISYMVGFYKSMESWHYERTTHQINIRLTDYEYEKFLEIPKEKNIDKFVYLLTEFNAKDPVEWESGVKTKQIVFKTGESVYLLFMDVPAGKKSEKFLACLYQYLQKKNLNEFQ